MTIDSIITLTPDALSHLKLKISKQNALGFRLGVKSSGCSGYRYVPEIISKAIDDDIKINYADDFVLYIAADAVDAVRGTEIDLVAKDLGLKQMVFNNPRAENHCGCGESFSIKQDEIDE
jgi:iron-sulfur cluster assembly accessory protein